MFICLYSWAYGLDRSPRVTELRELPMGAVKFSLLILSWIVVVGLAACKDRGANDGAVASRHGDGGVDWTKMPFGDAVGIQLEVGDGQGGASGASGAVQVQFAVQKGQDADALVGDIAGLSARILKACPQIVETMAKGSRVQVFGYAHGQSLQGDFGDTPSASDQCIRGVFDQYRLSKNVPTRTALVLQIGRVSDADEAP